MSGRRTAARLALLGIGAVAARGALAGLRRARSAGTWDRTNFRGRTVSLAGGPAIAAAATASAAVGAGTGSLAAAALIAGGGAGAVGWYDDLVGGRPEHQAKGFRGHLVALRDGRVTSGLVKIAGVGVAGLTAAALVEAGSGERRGGLRAAVNVALGGGVIAGTANLVNLLDLRPGRALKAGTVAATAMIAGPAGGIVAGPVGAAIAVLPADLGEDVMLGDAGANAYGALIGLAIATRSGPWRRAAILAGIGALTAASERVSFTKVIEATPVLREMDALGRRSDIRGTGAAGTAPGLTMVGLTMVRVPSRRPAAEVRPVPSDPPHRPDAEPNDHDLGDRPGDSPAGRLGGDVPGRSLAGPPGRPLASQPGEPLDPDVPVLVTTTSFTSPGLRRLAGAAALIAVLTIASRLLGFVRTLVLGKVAIAELSTAYLTANLIPNIIFEIVAGGALASLVVPLVAGAIARRDRTTVGATASALMTWVLIILVPLAVLVAVFAEPIVSVLLGAVGGDRGATVAVGTRMLRIFAPQIPLYGVGIVLSGLLQGHRRFAWPVLAPLLSSVVVIATYIVYGVTEPSVATIAEVTTRGQLILAIGTTLGVVALSLSLVVPVRALRLRWRPTVHFDSEARRSVSGLAAVGVVTVIAQQLTLALATRLANSDTPHGFIFVFTLAQTVYLVPWSVFALPVATSVYPALATAYATADEPTFRRTSAGATRSVALLSALGAAGMIAIAGPIARLFAATASQTRPDPSTLAAAIIAFAPGLVGYGLYALHSRTLFARGQNRYAAVATLAGWITVAIASVLLSIAFAPADRITALGAANSAGMAVLAAVLIVMIARRAGRDALRGVTRALVTAIFAAAVAAAAGIAVRLPLPSNPGVAGDVLAGILSGVVAVAVFATVAAVVDRRDLRPMVLRVVHATRGGRSGGSDGPGTDAGDRPGGDSASGRIGEPTG